MKKYQRSSHAIDISFSLMILKTKTLSESFKRISKSHDRILMSNESRHNLGSSVVISNISHFFILRILKAECVLGKARWHLTVFFNWEDKASFLSVFALIISIKEKRQRSTFSLVKCGKFLAHLLFKNHLAPLVTSGEPGCTGCSCTEQTKRLRLHGADQESEPREKNKRVVQERP